MKDMLSRPKGRLSFANVTSAMALFVALGGTSYAAIALPAGSVGQREIKTNGVGKIEIKSGGVGRSEVRASGVGKSEIATDGVGAGEIRKDAVDTTELRDGGIQAADVSAAARTALSGVRFRSAVTAAGTQSAGTAEGVGHTPGSGVYTVDLGQDVSACQFAATRSTPGLVTAALAADKDKVEVRTFTPGAAPAAEDAAFHLLVAC